MAVSEEQQRANLEKLAAYLEALPVTYEHFDMEGYASNIKLTDFDHVMYSDPSAATVTCGTVACAVGHGPAAGIPLLEKHLVVIPSLTGGAAYHDIDWDDYSENFAPTGDRDWAWMFSSSWASIDNSPFGAAARIRYYLDRGMPEGFGYICANWSDFIPLYEPYLVDAARKSAEA